MRAAAFVGLLLLGGCRPPHKPISVTMLIDISASIGAEGAPMDAAVASIANGLQRGDEVVVFPICDTAYSSRMPMRFKIPEKREAFNEETSRFRRELQAYVNELTSNSACKNTAILDTIARASSVPGDMYILTDGIEDSRISFYTDKHLGSQEEAEKLAKNATDKPKLQGKVRLGLIVSDDFGKLSRQRQYAIVQFWKTYLSELSSDAQVESPELLK